MPDQMFPATTKLLLKYLLILIVTVYGLEGNAVGWSSWSEWSTCSRSCGAGVSHQSRFCLDAPVSQSSNQTSTLCRGDDVRRRLCAFEECSERDRRAELCRLHGDSLNSVDEWVPVQELIQVQRSVRSCQLYCQSDTHLGDRSSVLLPFNVMDGAPCNLEDEGSQSGVCLNGKCEIVGCNGMIGLRVDSCGVCGGHDMDCMGNKVSPVEPEYQWQQTGFTTCSVTCGIGDQSSIAVCREMTSGDEVPETHCSAIRARPSHVRKCIQKSCETIWISGDWTECSRTCGGGVAIREVYCVEELRDGTYNRISDVECSRNKPPTERRCNLSQCPTWFAGQWSHCSVSCGVGFQIRAVVCRKTELYECSPSKKPRTRQGCVGLFNCRGLKDFEDSSDAESDAVHGLPNLKELSSYFSLTGNVGESTFNDFERGTEIAEHLGFEPERVHMTVTLAQHPTDSEGANDREVPAQVQLTENGTTGSTVAVRVFNESTPEGDMPDALTNNTVDKDPSLYDVDAYDQYQTSYIHRGGPAVENDKVASTPRFITSPWGRCSVSCSTGTRTRKVVCKVLEELSRKIVDLPDYNCHGPKPDDSEYCNHGPCPNAPVVKIVHSWALNGYSACSKTCGGGLQDPVYACYQQPGFTKVESDKCFHLILPYISKRPCNELPCPARWNILNKGTCSVTCGKGQQSRQIQCVQDVDSGDVRVVSDSMCKEPMPPQVILCTLTSCPPNWTVEDWTECSVTCGKGTQKRKVKCEDKSGESQPKDETACWKLSNKPESDRVCELPKCTSDSVIIAEHSNYVQLKPRKYVPLLVGQSATVIIGTTVFVQCKVKFKTGTRQQQKIIWTRKEKIIEQKRNHRVRTKKGGMLVIRTGRERDSGTYVCHYGQEATNITLVFHTSDDADDFARIRLGIRNADEVPGDIFPRAFDRKPSRNVSYSLLYMLREAAIEDIPLKYMTSAWSACSQSCGGGGVASRDVTCGMTTEEFALDVDIDYCQNEKFLVKPIADRDCGYDMCPSWEEGDWNECSDHSCVGDGMGLRNRTVQCISQNGEETTREKCDAGSIPTQTDVCNHTNCRAVWNETRNWTKCSVTCGRGVKNRVFQCVWASNGQPANASLCRDQTRKTVKKQCFTSSCPKRDPTVNDSCRDRSKYCQMIPVLQLCHYPQYRKECCSSCRTTTAIQQTTYSDVTKV